GAGFLCFFFFTAAEAGLNEIRRSRSLLDKIAEPIWKGEILLNMAEASLSAGHLDQARKYAREAWPYLEKMDLSKHGVVRSVENARRLGVCFVATGVTKERQGVYKLL